MQSFEVLVYTNNRFSTFVLLANSYKEAVYLCKEIISQWKYEKGVVCDYSLLMCLCLLGA